MHADGLGERLPICVAVFLGRHYGLAFAELVPRVHEHEGLAGNRVFYRPSCRVADEAAKLCGRPVEPPEVAVDRFVPWPRVPARLHLRDGRIPQSLGVTIPARVTSSDDIARTACGRFTVRARNQSRQNIRLLSGSFMNAFAGVRCRTTRIEIQRPASVIS